MKPSRKLKWIGILLPIVALAVLMLFPWESSSFPVPKPNGYDDFRHAANVLRGDTPVNWDQPALQMWVSENSETYALVRIGLQKSSRVAIEVSKGWGARHDKDVAHLKRLTHCLIAKAKLAEMEGRTITAFDDYMEAYRFAHEISRGGLALDFLNGISCKALVLEGFKFLVPSLTRPQCDEALKLIDSIESRKEDPKAVDQRVREWEYASFGIKRRLERWKSTVGEILKSRSLKPLASSRRYLQSHQELYEKKYVQPVREKLERSRNRSILVTPN